MADAKDGLFLKKRDVVSLDDARAEAEAARHPGAKLNDFVTRGWAMETFSKIALSLGQQMYDQVSGELAEHLLEMEKRLTYEIVKQVEARSFLGRMRTFTTRLLIRLGAAPKPKLMARVVDPVEALDPGVAARASELIDDEPIHTHAP